MTLDVEADTALPELAQGKKIVAVSHVGSGKNKEYPNHVELMKLLEKSGFHVWSRLMVPCIY